MYKDEWGVIVDNCNELLFLGSITHMDTLEYMSKLLGKGTFDKRTTGRTRGRQGSSSENFDVVGRELMTPDEINKIPKTHCIFKVGDRPPFYSEKYKYETHPNYRYTSDGNHSYSFHFTPELPPEEKICPHGEDEKTTAVPEIILEPSERTHIEVEEAELIDDPKQILKTLTEHFSELQPISDALMNDEELTSEEENVFLDTLLAEEEESENRVNVFMEVSAETKEYLENIEKDLPHLEENPVVILNHIGRIARELAPLPDEFFEDETYIGEQEKGQKAAEEVMEEIVMDEDEAQDHAGLEDIDGDIYEVVESLADLIGADPSFKDLLEETA